MSYGETCGRCGGMHLGSGQCPYLDEAVCFNCKKVIQADSGTDWSVHPNRKFDDLGRVYHSSCEVQPNKKGFFQKQLEAEEYFISFDTKANPGKLEAIRVRLDNVT